MNKFEAPLSRRPPRDMLGEFVKLQRTLYGWKQDTLAAKADVSLSTVQRAERGESIKDGSLEKLAAALNQPVGAFTTPRVPVSEEEAIQSVVDGFEWLFDTMPVSVAPLRHEAQLRDIADCSLSLIVSDCKTEVEDDLAELREWLDLASFVRAEDGALLPKRERSFSLRGLYKNILKAVIDMERRHKAVCLTGTYEAEGNMPGFEIVRVGIVSLRSREHNPAAGQIRQLMAEKKIDVRAAFRDDLERDEL